MEGLQHFLSELCGGTLYRSFDILLPRLPHSSLPWLESVVAAAAAAATRP